MDGHEDTWAIVTGLNLPMLIEAYAARMSMDTAHEVAKHITKIGREGIKPKQKHWNHNLKQNRLYKQHLKELFQKVQLLVMVRLSMY